MGVTKQRPLSCTLFIADMSMMAALLLGALAAGPMGFDEARHLLNRTSFAANVDDINAFAKLTREMVLFWHNHFVSTLQKVKSPALMYRQHMLLRKHAFGYFGDFLHDIAKDPAMVVYLDSASNRKGQPNENCAREVMELFTLGEGNYAENDIKG